MPVSKQAHKQGLGFIKPQTQPFSQPLLSFPDLLILLPLISHAKRSLKDLTRNTTTSKPNSNSKTRLSPSIRITTMVYFPLESKGLIIYWTIGGVLILGFIIFGMLWCRVNRRVDRVRVASGNTSDATQRTDLEHLDRRGQEVRYWVR